MMLEFTASRLLAPWFGTSQLVWGNVIGVILMALSLGYFLGGRLADRRPETKILLGLTLVAGLLACVAPLLAVWLASQFNLLALATGGGALYMIIGSFIAICILFALPVTLLGMVSPYAIRLATPTLEQTGSVAGSLYAWSTVGSIVGTFISAFWLVPVIGSRETLLLSATLLLGIACLGFGRSKWWLWFVLLLPLAVHIGFLQWSVSETNILTAVDSSYQYIRIRDDGDRLSMIFNEGIGTQSYYMKYGVLTNSYYDYMSLVPELQSMPANANVVVLGLAGGTITRQLRHYYPNYSITGVEIDPTVVQLARQYFDLDQQQIKTVVQDSRVFMQTTTEQFDLIVLDSFTNEYYIPWHLTTQEFFTTVHDHITPGGALVFNIGSLGEDTALFASLIATLQSTFPEVNVVPIPDSLNYVVIASTEPLNSTALATVHGERAGLAHLAKLGLHPANTSSAQVLRDNRAPIEWYTEAMVLEFLQS